MDSKNDRMKLLGTIRLKPGQRAYQFDPATLGLYDLDVTPKAPGVRARAELRPGAVVVVALNKNNAIRKIEKRLGLTLKK